MHKGYSGKPVKSYHFSHIITKSKRSERPIPPSFAKVLYEILDKPPELDFLREFLETSGVKIEILPELADLQISDPFQRFERNY